MQKELKAKDFLFRNTAFLFALKLLMVGQTHPSKKKSLKKYLTNVAKGIAKENYNTNDNTKTKRQEITVAKNFDPFQNRSMASSFTSELFNACLHVRTCCIYSATFVTASFKKIIPGWRNKKSKLKL